MPSLISGFDTNLRNNLTCFFNQHFIYIVFFQKYLSYRYLILTHRYSSTVFFYSSNMLCCNYSFISIHSLSYNNYTNNTRCPTISEYNSIPSVRYTPITSLLICPFGSISSATFSIALIRSSRNSTCSLCSGNNAT